MKLITVAGPPSSGKTSVILHIIGELKRTGLSAGVVKFDCLTSHDAAAYHAGGIGIKTGISGGLCPDHFFVSNIEQAFEWALKKNYDYLITESAGLCNRCSPHIKGVPAVCVIDNLSGINTPAKIGPMLKSADAVIITKGDIVSQAEREVFSFKVRQVNPAALIFGINGITGQGSFLAADFFRKAQETESLRGTVLRFTMPGALCSYCLGERHIGEDRQIGVSRLMDFSEYDEKK